MRAVTDFELESTPDGVDLVVTGGWSDDARSAVEQGRADGLVLNYARGFKERDLRFLEGLPLRRLQVLARTHKDLTPIYSIASTLRSLRVQSDPGAVIELERLPELRTLSASWGQVAGSLRYAQQLTDLFVLAYDEPDLRALGHNAGLERVRMKDRPAVRTLEGLGELTALSELGLYLAPVLSDIEALTSAPAGLRRLDLPSCVHVPDLEPVAGCTGLRFLDVSECGETPTLQPLAALSELEVLLIYGSTKIADGDLTPLTRLPRLHELRMQNRRGYRPSVKDVQAGLARADSIG